MIWPKENEIEGFYGKFNLGDDGYPTAFWKKQNLTQIVPPYQMLLAWDTSKKVRVISCHRKVMASIENILQRIKKEILSANPDSRVKFFGGVYEFRRVSGSSKLSLHAYGAAIDLDPENNGRGVPYDGGVKMIDPAVVQIFKDDGWRWGGDFKNPDCMHFEAVSE